MQNKNKLLAIAIAILLSVSTATTISILPFANAHSPAWQIPTQGYIVAAPSIIGVGQPVHVYMWLTAVYGAAGGTGASTGTNGSTASAALLSNNYRWHNYNLTIVAPDGTKSTQIFPVISDTTSSQYTVFTPTQIGMYTFIFNFPGQVYGENGNGYEKSTLMGDYYLPVTATTTLNVQEEQEPAPINSYPLPTAYWARPIYGENTDWWAISSNWLGSGSAPPGGYSTSGSFSQLYHNDAVGSLTSHVMWTRQLQFGGVVGGNQFLDGGSNPNGAAPGSQYFEGTSYQPRFVNPILINGYLYYTEPISFSGPSAGATVAVDLRTGKVLWERTDVPTLSFGYIYNLWDPDQHGVFPPILFTTNFARAFDAYTGEQLFNVTGVPGGTSVMGPSGEQLRYVLSNLGNSANPNYHLAQWNSSRLWVYDINPFTGGGSLSPSLINVTNAANTNPTTHYLTSAALVTSYPVSKTSNSYGNTITVNGNIPLNDTTMGLTGVYANTITTYDWNISLSALNSISPSPSIVAANYGDMLLCRSGTLPTGFGATRNGAAQAPYTYFGVNLNASKGAVGSILWSKSYNPPPNNLTLSAEPVDFTSRVFTFSYQETMQWVGYDLDSGAMLWGPTASQGAWDYYGYPGTTTLPGVTAYGHLYCSSFGGICYAYNLRTGNIDWTYGNGGEGNSTYGGLQVFYGVYPTQIQAIGNGVIYLATNEHTMPNPFYKGCVATAINATTGEQIWQLSMYPSTWSSPGTEFAIGDGFTTFMNGLDNNVYSVGRGPSQLTVSAPDLAAASGQAVVIKGTVVDISAGTKQDQQAADFPNGVPCSSDASMKDWMGYVYQQKPLPTDFTGVTVSIDVVDTNGNFRNIGTATTDYTGAYSLVWKPDIPGTYNVIASFAGNNGYWPSSATTAFNVMEEHPTATPAPTAAPSMSEVYFIPAIAGLFVFVAIMSVVIIIVLRKRP
jgi:hypothetical protein